MEPHSLALITASTLDPRHHSHLHGAQARRAQPLPLHNNPRRPLRNLAQGLARLLPQLRQFSQRLRRIPSACNADGSPLRPLLDPASTVNPDVISTSEPACCVETAQTQIQSRRIQRWHASCRAHLFRLRNRQPDHQRRQQQRLSVQGLQPQLEEKPEQEQRQHDVHDVHPERPSCPADVQPLHRHPHGTLPQHRRGPLRQLRRVLRLLARHLSPVGPGDNDKSLPERLLNVATCGMFFQAGGKIVRLCGSLAARRFGWAFIAVGAIATLYHGSWGRLRPLARKVDYYSIALSSLLLRAAVVGPAPRWLGAAMLATIPFKPSLVSSSNFMAVEVRYMLLALSQRHLLPEWAAHAGLSVAASACFTLEDTPLLSWCPYTHAAFHTLSAAAFLTLPAALNQLTAAAA